MFDLSCAVAIGALVGVAGPDGHDAIGTTFI